MNNSLSALKEIPEFKSSQKNLEKFQDRLENAVKPHLLQALQEHNVGMIMKFLRIFLQLFNF